MMPLIGQMHAAGRCLTLQSQDCEFETLNPINNNQNKKERNK